MTEPTKDTTPAAPVSATPDVSTEPTPVGDEAQAAAQAASQAVDKESQGADEADVPDAPETANSYKVDIARALERETQDGKGDEDPGPGDWQGYATEGVEVED